MAQPRTIDKLSYPPGLRVMNELMKYLEAFKTKMTSVGRKANDNLSAMFNYLKRGILGKQSCYQSPICKWSFCNTELNCCEELFQHTREHILIQDDVAPCLRKYECKWENCGKIFQNKTLL